VPLVSATTEDMEAQPERVSLDPRDPGEQRAHASGHARSRGGHGLLGGHGLGRHGWSTGFVGSFRSHLDRDAVRIGDSPLPTPANYGRQVATDAA